MGRRRYNTEEERIAAKRRSQRERDRRRNSQETLRRQSAKEELARAKARQLQQLQQNHIHHHPFPVYNQYHQQHQYQQYQQQHHINQNHYHTSIANSAMLGLSFLPLISSSFNPQFNNNITNGIGSSIIHIPTIDPPIISSSNETWQELSIPIVEPDDSKSNVEVSDILNEKLHSSIIKSLKDQYSNEKVIKFGMYSMVIKGWAKFFPEVMAALEATLVPKYDHLFNTEEGLAVSIDAPFGENANVPTASYYCRKVFRNYWGRVIDGDWLYCYGTATGAYTVGIPPNQFVNRAFDKHMDLISRYILRTMNNHPAYADEESVVKELTNHATLLNYYPKRQQMKTDMQLALHRDCLWSDDNEWLPNKNSQKMNTPTYSVTIGHPRTIMFQEFSADGQVAGVTHEIVLENWDLMILDPRDEKMMLRGGKKYKTYFKHGGVKISSTDDLLSLGLIFRSVTAKQQFDPKTGHFIITEEFWNSLSSKKKQEYNRRERKLKEVTRSGALETSHERLKKLFDEMRAIYFK